MAVTSFQRIARAGERLQIGLIVVCLALGTGIVYGQVLGFDFINADDHSYVTKNIRVQRGLTGENLIWAFTSMSVANWHPLTWLSHMLDIDLYGLDPRGHHLGNLLLHIANTLLLFGLLRSFSGALWRSASVAALFAIHPLHVESVAWVSERKDLLCAFFWFLAMWSYGVQIARARTQGRRPRLAMPWALFACALLAKPMAVTLPFALLLLDYWPLRRLDGGSLWRRIGEKLPFFALSLASSILTLLAQREGGAMQGSLDVSVWQRVANAAVSYATYLVKCAWPVDLAYLYPHPYIPGTGGVPWEIWQIAGSIALLVALSALVALSRRAYLSMGWLWYLGTLVPTIGIVQVGTQAFADRYTYVPLIGVFILVVWGVADLAAHLRERRAASNSLAFVGLALLAALFLTLGSLSWKQANHWRGSIPLFEHTLRITPDNSITHLALASSLVSADRMDEAMRHASRALELKPDYGEAHGTIGRVHGLMGRHGEALRSLQRAVSLSPRSARLHFNLGNQLLQMEQVDSGMKHLERAALLSSDWPKPHVALAEVLRRQGRLEEAVGRYRTALEIQPEQNDTRLKLARSLAKLGRRDEAIAQYEAVLARDPQHAKARYDLERTLQDRGVKP